MISVKICLQPQHTHYTHCFNTRMIIIKILLESRHRILHSIHFIFYYYEIIRMNIEILLWSDGIHTALNVYLYYCWDPISVTAYILHSLFIYNVFKRCLTPSPTPLETHHYLQAYGDDDDDDTKPVWPTQAMDQLTSSLGCEMSIVETYKCGRPSLRGWDCPPAVKGRRGRTLQSAGRWRHYCFVTHWLTCSPATQEIHHHLQALEALQNSWRKQNGSIFRHDARG
jgi:hypothetical protein